MGLQGGEPVVHAACICVLKIFKIKLFEPGGEPLGCLVVAGVLFPGRAPVEAQSVKFGEADLLVSVCHKNSLGTSLW